jgi:cob(I)alamin adenosyltransferase
VRVLVGLITQRGIDMDTVKFFNALCDVLFLLAILGMIKIAILLYVGDW